MKKNWGRSAQELKMSSVRKPGKKLMSPGFSNPKMIQLMHILPMKYPMLDPIYDCQRTWNGCNYIYEWPFLEFSTYLSEIGRNLKTDACTKNGGFDLCVDLVDSRLVACSVDSWPGPTTNQLLIWSTIANGPLGISFPIYYTRFVIFFCTYFFTTDIVQKTWSGTISPHRI